MEIGKDNQIKYSWIDGRERILNKEKGVKHSANTEKVASPFGPGNEPGPSAVMADYLC